MRRKASKRRKGFRLFSSTKRDKNDSAVEMDIGQETAEPAEYAKKKGRKKRRNKPKGSWKESLADFFKNKVVLGIICVVFSVLAVFAGGPALQSYQARRVPVVKIAVDVPADTVITQDMLILSDIGAIDIPDNAAADVEQVIGLYTSVDMVKGDIITVSKVQQLPQLDDIYLYDLPPGKQAISVSIGGLAEGLSGKLRHGDVVSLYAAIYNAEVEDEYFALQPLELKYVKVLAVSNSYGVDVEEGNRSLAETDRNTNLPATITLLVNDQQAAALAGLDKNATLYAALVIRDDPDTAQLYLDAQDEYFIKLEEDETEEEESTQQPEALPTEQDVEAGAEDDVEEQIEEEVA